MASNCMYCVTEEEEAAEGEGLTYVLYSVLSLIMH